jgi:stress-induced morphogen
MLLLLDHLTCHKIYCNLWLFCSRTKMYTLYDRCFSNPLTCVLLVSKSIVRSFNTVRHESQLHATPQLCFVWCVRACVQHFPVPLYSRQFCNMTSADRTKRLRECVEICWNCLWFSLDKLYGALLANSCHRARCTAGRLVSTSQRSA